MKASDLTKEHIGQKVWIEVEVEEVDKADKLTSLKIRIEPHIREWISGENKVILSGDYPTDGEYYYWFRGVPIPRYEPENMEFFDEKWYPGNDPLGSWFRLGHPRRWPVDKQIKEFIK